MKTYTVEGREFITKAPTLAVENFWLDHAINEDGTFNKSVIREFSRDPDAVNEFMRLMLKGDHTGIDWYHDAPTEIFGEVFADFFTPWSAKMIAHLDTLSTGSEQTSLSVSESSEPLPLGGA